MGLLIATCITTALALCGFALLLRRARDWRPLALAFVVTLPLQPLMMYVVRLPLDGLLRTTYGMIGWVTIAALFYAPLTEEPAKWLAAAVPRVRRAIVDDPISLALAAGVGFGVGEIWFLAHALDSPDYAKLAFWMFGGFMMERLAVCFLHGAFLVPPFLALARGHSFLLGGLVGMLMHFLLNFPIYLAQIDAFSLGQGWVLVLLLWMIGFVVIGVVLIRHLARSVRDAKGRESIRDQSGFTPP